MVEEQGLMVRQLNRVEQEVLFRHPSLDRMPLLEDLVEQDLLLQQVRLDRDR
jgi:hypothetical protein